MSLVFDTGPLLSVLDGDDRDHARCIALLRESREDRVIPAPVLPELAYWIEKRLRPAALIDVLDSISAGAYRVEPLELEDYDRIRELCQRYGDTPVGSSMPQCSRWWSG